MFGGNLALVRVAMPRIGRRVLYVACFGGFVSCIVYRLSCIFRYSRCVARREPSRSYVLHVVCVSRQRCIRMRGPQCATPRPCLGTFACRERALLRWPLGLPAFAPPAEPRVRCRVGGRCAFMPVPVDVPTTVYPALPPACGAAERQRPAHRSPVSLLGLRRRVGASPALLPRTRQVRRAWRSRRAAGARFGLCNAALPPSPAFLA
jgi:hypothetical protein